MHGRAKCAGAGPRGLAQRALGVRPDIQPPPARPTAMWPDATQLHIGFWNLSTNSSTGMVGR
jgi:hypothetical protein